MILYCDLLTEARMKRVPVTQRETSWAIPAAAAVRSR